MMQIKEKLQKPQIFLLIMVMLEILVLYICYGFKTANYYIDKKAAHLFLNNSLNVTMEQLFDLYGNKNYLLHNGFFHILTFTAILLFFSVLFKIQSYKEFCNIKILSNKVFLYIYLNAVYPLWMYFTQKVTEIEIEKYVYPIHSDSLSIAFLGVYALLFIMGVIYYPIVNIFNFIVYNTKFVNKFLILMYKILFVLVVLYILLNISNQYSIDYIFVYTIEIIYLFIVINTINYLYQKNIK